MQAVVIPLVSRRAVWRVFAVAALVVLVVLLLPKTPILAEQPPTSGTLHNIKPLGLIAAGPEAHRSSAPRSSRGESKRLTFYSRALDRTMDYWIYLPPGYGAPGARFPVLYMLHGRDADCSQWQQLGLFEQAERFITEGTIAPLIIVAPQGDFGYWMNHADNGPRWGDYVTSDLIEHIDTAYATLPSTQHRAIGGISMGGHGAIQLALNHPELFVAAGGHSAVFRRQEEAPSFFGVGDVYQRHDPVSLVQSLHVDVPFALWLDMGDADSWTSQMNLFHSALAERNIPHEWHLSPGGHDDAYWMHHIPAYLRWYDNVLKQGLPALSKTT